ncbi:alpha/beta hydrolase [Microbispora rosea]|uniref:alpha/beta hydrolase n=1 Tax=Microbispora rosea TaxID=58117 RepID=UPI00378F0D06
MPTPGSDPGLVVGVRNNPATPYRWAPRLAAQLGTAVLLTLSGELRPGQPRVTGRRTGTGPYSARR